LQSRDDDYELMPSSELDYLRKEVEKLKRNPLGDTQASITLLDSINKLNTTVSKLNTIFEGANDDMVKAFNETAIQDQMIKLLEQQEKLAKGIVAVAELVKDLQEQQKKELPEIEQVISQSRAAQEMARPQPQMNVQSIASDIQTQAVMARERNPFSEEQGGNPDFRPLLNEPLPRPASASGMPLRAPQGMPASPPPLAATDRISDNDIPPPPPRRY